MKKAPLHLPSFMTKKRLVLLGGALVLALFAGLILAGPARAALLQARAETLIYSAMPADQYALSGGNYCDPFLQAAVDRSQLDQAWALLNQAPANPRRLLARGRVACLAGDPAGARRYYEEAASLNPDDPLPLLELAFTAETLGDMDTAQTLWRSIGQEHFYFLEAADLNNAARPLARLDGVDLSPYQRALAWIRRANLLFPENPDTLYQAGRVCQALGIGADPICQAAYALRGSNFLLNAINPRLPGWEVAGGAGIGYVFQVECPGLPGQMCATVSHPGTPEPGGLFQCARLEGGRDYRLSAWIRVDGPPELRWNALHVEGSSENLAENTGPAEWGFWEIQLHPPAGADEMACVTPIRLHSGGQGWFHSARLEYLN